MKKQRHHYELDYKRHIVQEYLAGVSPAEELARREGLERGQIYKWRVQLERRDRLSCIEVINIASVLLHSVLNLYHQA